MFVIVYKLAQPTNRRVVGDTSSTPRHPTQFNDKCANDGHDTICCAPLIQSRARRKQGLIRGHIPGRSGIEDSFASDLVPFRFPAAYL